MDAALTCPASFAQHQGSQTLDPGAEQHIGMFKGKAHRGNPKYCCIFRAGAGWGVGRRRPASACDISS
eukprot:2586495-Pyramimonas_sp.AAC.2